MKGRKEYKIIYRSPGGVPSSRRVSCTSVVLMVVLAMIGMCVLVGLSDVVLVAVR